MKAIARQLRITPRKLNLIAGLVRNRDVNTALGILQMTPKKGARMLYKVLKSAVANAENNFKQERNSLYVKEIVVNKAVTLKRNVPISRGRVHPILKRSAHVHILVGVKEQAAKDESGHTQQKGTELKSAAPKKTAAKKTSGVTKVKA